MVVRARTSRSRTSPVGAARATPSPVCASFCVRISRFLVPFSAPSSASLGVGGPCGHCGSPGLHRSARPSSRHHAEYRLLTPTGVASANLVCLRPLLFCPVSESFFRAEFNIPFCPSDGSCTGGAASSAAGVVWLSDCVLSVTTAPPGVSACMLDWLSWGAWLCDCVCISELTVCGGPTCAIATGGTAGGGALPLAGPALHSLAHPAGPGCYLTGVNCVHSLHMATQLCLPSSGNLATCFFSHALPLMQPFMMWKKHTSA